MGGAHRGARDVQLLPDVLDRSAAVLSNTHGHGNLVTEAAALSNTHCHGNLVTEGGGAPLLQRGAAGLLLGPDPHRRPLQHPRHRGQLPLVRGKSIEHM